MYYLSQGLLKVYSSNSYGYDRVIAFLKDDNIFGLDCLDPDQPSVVTIECVTDSWVMPLAKRDAHRHHAGKPRLCL